MYKVIAFILCLFLLFGCNNSEVKQNVNDIQEVKDNTTDTVKETTTNTVAENSKVQSATGLNTTGSETTDSTWQISTDTTSTTTTDTWSTDTTSTTTDTWSTDTTSTTPTNTSLTASTNTSSTTTTGTTKNTNSSGSSIILIMKTNDLVEEEDKGIFVKAVVDKWLKGKEYTQMDSDTFDETMGQYEGRKVLTANILRAYGEFEITVRTGTIVKDADGPYENPIKNWSARGAQTAEDVVKEISYAKDVFAK